MKNIKGILIAIFAVASFSVGAQERRVELDAQSAGAMLGQAAISRHVRPEHKKILESILLGQSYDQRSSVYNVECTLNVRADLRTCVFSIGVDDLNDDDRGWGSSYRLKIETEGSSSHMLSVEMEMFAG